MSLFNVSAAELIEPTADVDVDTPTEDIATEEVSEVVDNEVDEQESDIEDSSEEESAGDGDEEAEEDVFIVDGQEFTLEQLENAKDIESTKKSLVADYTKKTMAVADQRKDLEVKHEKVDALARELEVLVGEDNKVDWDELEEDDPEEYIKLQKRAEKRKQALRDVKSNLKPQEPELSQDEIAAEQQALVEAFPEWVKRDDKGQVIEVMPKYQEDLQAISKHALELGFTEKQLAEIKTAPIIKALMNSLKSKEKSQKIEIAKKKVKPKSVKPKSVASTKPRSLFNKSVQRG